jgi:fibronectin-binding autotransporter adhesin
LNFVAKFDGALSAVGVGFHPKAQPHVETLTTKAPADAIIVQDASLLFHGNFKRSGTDLVISHDERELVLADYFKGEKKPLASVDGAYLTGKIVDALTGHVQLAQADGSASVAKIIGAVTKLNGNATVVRNGVSIILNQGDNVLQGDVVQSGSNSTLGITFIDGSVFGLGPNARMVLNEMIYDPNGSNNSSLLSLVQGTISFVAGATAKHGDMKVDTPVATMGIRGTAVLVEIDFEIPLPQIQQPQPQLTTPSAPARFQILVEPDGTSGAIVLLDKPARQAYALGDRHRQPAGNDHHRQRHGCRHLPADRNTFGRCATRHQRSVHDEVHR